MSGFRFDDSVARVFPDMLDRSIPGYATIIAQTGLLAAQYAQPGTRLYDLGCSLGGSALAMQAAIARSDDDRSSCEIIGIDSSPAMIERGRAFAEEQRNRLADRDVASRTPSVELQEGDLTTHPLANASLIAMNFTLQFIAPAAREAMMQRIADALVPGGVLILSEKVTFTDPEINAQNIAMYHAFKQANGYSALEVAQKRTALENVLVPDTLATHERRLHEAGFERIDAWFRCFNFASLIAVRK